MSKTKGWKEIPIGGTIVEPGSSVEFDVTAWRTFRPVFDKSKCTKCGMCWIFCPEGAIKINDDGTYDVDLSFCKGCGICQRACAVKAITMVKEG
ncbi:MAG: 4Fe-4S binding protein [Candidatus Methanomethylicaceae archaeon]